MKKTNSKEVVLTIVVGFGVLFLLFQKQSLLIISLSIGVVGILSDYLSDKIAQGWMFLAKILGKIFPPIILGLVFFLFLTPIALIQKLFSKTNSLNLKKPTSSIFMVRDHSYKSKDFENLW